MADTQYDYTKDPEGLLTALWKSRANTARSEFSKFYNLPHDGQEYLYDIHGDLVLGGYCVRHTRSEWLDIWNRVMVLCARKSAKHRIKRASVVSVPPAGG